MKATKQILDPSPSEDHEDFHGPLSSIRAVVGARRPDPTIPSFRIKDQDYLHYPCSFSQFEKVVVAGLAFSLSQGLFAFSSFFKTVKYIVLTINYVFLLLLA